MSALRITLTASCLGASIASIALSPWPLVEQTRAAFDALGLETDAALRGVVARMLTLTDRDVGLAWLSALCDLPPDRRVAAACTALDSGVVHSMPDPAALRVR